MRTVWKINGGEKLLLIFSGWAMDEHPTSIIEANVADVCTCFDYQSLEITDLERWGQYPEINLIAWSTGVWAAEQVLGNSKIKLSHAIAVNGTPTTVHDETGIPRAIFQATYDNLNSISMTKFTRRMLGNSEAFNAFKSIEPKRDLENQKQELGTILEVKFEELLTGKIRWDKAIIGTKDAIFPPSNQRNYWEGKTEIEEIEAGHFIFYNYLFSF
jgi:pimeloyl-[acyl-carrier protein] methyl ester esterase